MPRCHGTRKSNGNRCRREVSEGDLCWQHADVEGGASRSVPRGRTCTVCAHPERSTIDEELVGGAANRATARRHGLDKDAVRRHRKGHLPETLAKAQEAAEAVQADDLFGQLQNLQERTLAILTDAENDEERKVALRAIREAWLNVELMARVLGELDDSPNVNVTLSPQWFQVRAVLVDTLAPFPEARAAVAGALQRIESDDGNPGN